MAKKNNVCEVSFKQGTKKIVITFTEDEDKMLSYKTDLSKFGEIENTSAKTALTLANFFLLALNQIYKNQPNENTASDEETHTDTVNNISEN